MLIMKIVHFRNNQYCATYIKRWHKADYIDSSELPFFSLYTAFFSLANRNQSSLIYLSQREIQA